MANPLLIVGVLGAIGFAIFGKKSGASGGGGGGAAAPAMPGSGGLVPITPLVPHPSGVNDFPAGPSKPGPGAAKLPPSQTNEPSVPDDEDPRLDADLPAALRAAVLGVLDDPNATSEQLDAAADAAEGAGHPIAAASLRAAAQAKSFAAGPAVNPGATAPQANPGNTTLQDIEQSVPGFATGQDIAKALGAGTTPLDANPLGSAVSALDAMADKAAADAMENGDDSETTPVDAFDPSQALNDASTAFDQGSAAEGSSSSPADDSDSGGSTIDSILGDLGL